MKKRMIITMPNGIKYSVPVSIIAEHRAAYYKDEFGGGIFQSLEVDTIPLFESDEFEIIDWAQNNMDWKDVKEVAEIFDYFSGIDSLYQEGWVNGEKELKD